MNREKKEKIKIINSLNEEKKEIDFLNLINNYNFSDGLDINEGKKFIKEFKIKYENLELLLESFVYNEYLSLFMNCNIYSLIINNLIFNVNEESKKRLEEYIEKLNLKEKLENKLTTKNKEKRSKI